MYYFVGDLGVLLSQKLSNVVLIKFKKEKNFTFSNDNSKEAYRFPLFCGISYEITVPQFKYMK